MNFNSPALQVRLFSQMEDKEKFRDMSKIE